MRSTANYGLEMVTPTKKTGSQAEDKIFTGINKNEHYIDIIWTLDLINEHVRGTVQVERFEDIAREARLRWFGHLQRKQRGYQGCLNDF